MDSFYKKDQYGRRKFDVSEATYKKMQADSSKSA